MRYLVLVGLFFFSLCSGALAQENENKKHGYKTYLEGSVFHAEGDIEGFRYNINGLAVDIETYFNGSHIGLSGWSIGYRKDDLRYSDTGQLFNFKVFRITPLKILDL